MKMKFYKFFSILTFLLFLSNFTNAQLSVTANSTATALATNLAGQGVSITNATLVCPNDGAGTFDGSTSNIGLGSGVLLTSGSVNDAPGPNNSGSTGTNGFGALDPDLQSLEPEHDCDACVLQFDFVPLGNTITFNYVFASEEYPEFFCGSFNDVFGFFITGPNPSGGTYNAQNIALIPGSTTPVAINNVGPGTCNGVNNSNLYMDNNQNTVEYDGFTVVLPVTANVVPCQTYTLKLGVGDGGDCIYDSGVFIEENSLVSVGYLANGEDISVSCEAETCSSELVELEITNGDALTWSISPTTGVTMTSATEFDIVTASSQTYMLTGTSACNTVTKDITITVSSDAQANIAPAGMIGCAGQAVVLDGSASMGSTFLWSGPGIVSGATTNTATVNVPGTYTLTVTDAASGCMDEASVNVAGGADIQNPVINTCPPSRIYQGCDTNDIGTPDLAFSTAVTPVTNFTAIGGVASDDCGIATITYIDTQNGTCPTVVSRTYTITDTAGNTTECTQTITIQDSTLPVLNGVPASTTASCENIPTSTSPTATDNCDQSVSISFEETTTPGSCDDTFTLNRTWTATDDCGNSAVSTQFITVSDNTSPVLSAFPANTVVECDQVPPAETLTATDNCDPNVPVIFSEQMNAGACADGFQITRTWEATDRCGNLAAHVQLITVEDNTPPVITGVPASGLVECDQVPPAPTPTITDNCTLNPNIDFVENIVPGSCDDAFTITRSWTVTDDCGNVVSESQTLTVVDTTVPVLSETPANITVECDAIPTPPTVTATDNCTPDITVSFVEQTNPGTCDGSSQVVRTWEAIDLCGNSATHTQLITVEDTTPPTVICQDITVSPDPATGMVTITPNDIDNGSTDNCSAVTLSLDISTFSCSVLGDTPVVLTATDACGNNSSCQANVFVNSSVESPKTRNAFHCIGKEVSMNEGLEAICASCDAGGTSTVEWYDAEFGGNLVGTGPFFHPVGAGIVPDNQEGCYTFYAQCFCDTEVCPSFRTKASFQVLDCEVSCEDGCTYFLVLEDEGCNGWDGASIDVSVNEAWPATNYKLQPSDCNGFGNYMVVPVQVNDGGTIDIAYWNGAFELEHAYAVLNHAKDTIYASGYDANNCNNTTPSVTPQRIKANCPACCINEFEDYTVRIRMGDFPEEQSWEIYEGAADTVAQGPQVFGITANTYAGLAPGTVMTHDIQLEKCKTYTFVAFDGFNDSWNGGSWELITSNISYGTEITDTDDAFYGNSLVLSGPADAAFIDEERIDFTLPCQNCYDAPILLDGADAATCVWSGDIPVNEPYVCYPNCNHALPAGCVGEELIVLVNGDPNAPLSVANGPFSYTNGVGTVAVAGLPVGHHEVVQVTTYCDGIITKCTTDLIIVNQVDPNLTCNDLVHISLGTPEWNDDDNQTGNPFLDDLGECVIEITPDMVLEMPTFCNDEYKVVILDENQQPLVVYDVDGFPLDEAGFSIFPGNQSSTPAHNFVSAAQAGQTLTYVVEHIYSDNKCWGEILVEDKYNPTIVCEDYELACTHPNALDEFYSQTNTYTPSMELPANIAGGTPGLVSNTFIPINLPCGPFGEVIQGLEVAVDLTHTNIEDIIIILHAPSAVNLPAITLAGNGQVEESNTFSVGALAGLPCSITASTSPEDFITENSGTNNVPDNVGGTWYIQIIDNNEHIFDNPPEPYGGGEVTAASITLSCGFPFPYGAYDCTLAGVSLLSEEIVETNCNQVDWNGAQIIRVWEAVDAFGNSSKCTQTVNLKAPTMDQIRKPGDLTLECTGQSPESITPETSGRPGFDCFAMNQTDHHGLCDISYTYEDLVLPTCGQGYKIIRTWTYINWCSGVTKYEEQVIKVDDTTGPTINVDDIVSNTAVYECQADLSFNEAVTDGCSGVESIEVRYTLGGGAYGSDDLVIVDVTNGGTLDNLPLGVTQIMVIAKDACLNVTEELVSITIEDNTAPVAVCDDNLHVSLGSDGQAWVYAEDIDEGSWDNCGIASIEVRRVGGCLGSSAWSDAAPLDCCDLNQDVTIELRVTDNAGNSNICWQTVLVEDAIAPTITCPDNVTVDCSAVALHSMDFGDPIADDNCSVNLEYSETDDRDQCKAGTITRRWTASDNSDKSQDASCTQRVTVNHVSDFIVQFPPDATVNTCPDDLGLSGEPTISDDDCELLAINYDDLILTIVDDACYKIERTWTVINWCIYDNENTDVTDLGIPQPLPNTYQDDDGYFQYTQIIKVLDSEAPVITCPGDQTFCDLTEDCEGEAQLTIEVEDGCSPADVLEYTYKIDAFNDGSFDIVETGNDATNVYPYGTHLIKWIVEDGCGNTSECSYLFTIEDCKNPTPVCLNGITIENMQTGCVEVPATALLEYAFDNCSSDEFVENTVKIKRTNFAGSPSNSVTLCCDDLGIIPVEIYVEDEAGNVDFCVTYIDVQDNLNNCPQDLSRAIIGGSVETEQGNMVEDVMMEVAGGSSTFLPTTLDGTYSFPSLNMYQNYTITPEKNHEPTNGVSTFDLVVMSQHILGVNYLTSPYQMIAADVNNDGHITTFDVVQTRQLILFILQDFPENSSWRFVDKDYMFPNPQNPWVEAFPEVVNFASLDQDELATDFIAIKIGDVTGDALTNANQVEERNLNGTLNFRIENTNLEQGQSIEIPVKASNFDNITGFQYTLHFDANAMEFEGVKPRAIHMSDAHVGTTYIEEGILTSSWNSSEAKSFDAETALFVLVFKSKANQDLENAIAINSRYTKAEAYNNTGMLDVILEVQSENGIQVAEQVFELHQNQPNPFNGETMIGFTLPQASAATLKVFDSNGKLLKIINGDFAKGYNQVQLTTKELGVNGLLYYELTTDSNSATKKMLLLE